MDRYSVHEPPIKFFACRSVALGRICVSLCSSHKLGGLDFCALRELSLLVEIMLLSDF